MLNFNTIWTQHNEKILIISDQAIVSGSNFVIGILISKILGLAELGIYSFVWMILMISSSLQQAFIHQPMINEYMSLPKENTHLYILKLYALQIYTAFALVILILVAITLFQSIAFFHNLIPLIKVLPFLIMVYIMNDFGRRVYILLNKMTKVLVLDFIVNWSQVSFLLYHLHNKNLDLSTIIFAFSISYSLNIVVSAIDFFKIKIFFSNLWEIAQKHWIIAKWLLLTAVAQWFAGNFFIISSGELLGTEAAGIVRIAQSIVGVLNVFFIALEYYVPAKSVLIYNKWGKSALLKYTGKVIWIGILICGLFTLMVYLTSDQVLNLLYGPNYRQYGLIITIFSAFYIIVFTGYPLRFALRAMQDTKAMFIAYLLATLFSILFAKHMIIAWDIWGVIAGLTMTQMVMQAWYLKALIKKPQINFNL